MWLPELYLSKTGIRTEVFLFFLCLNLLFGYFSACPTTENEYPKIKAYSEIYIFPLTHATKYMCVCISIIISIQQWIAVFLPMEVFKLWKKCLEFLKILSGQRSVQHGKNKTVFSGFSSYLINSFITKVFRKRNTVSVLKKIATLFRWLSWRL